MSESIVLYCKGNPLLLDSIERDVDGRIKKAWVVNGAWRYERLGNTVAAKEHWYGHTVNQWHQTIDDELEVPIVGGFRYDEYDDVIASANISREAYYNEAKVH